MSHVSSSRIAKPKAKPHKPHKTSPRSTTSPASNPLIFLQTYVSNIFFDIFIQDQDDIAEIAYKRNWSAHVKENGDGQPFTFNSFHDYIFNNLRTTLTNRQLVSQSFVVEPEEKDGGRTGTVAHILQLSAIQDGKEVIANGVGVLQIGWDEEEMRRVVKMESFVLAIE